MNDWKQCVKETVEAMGSRCGEMPPDYAEDTMVIMSVNPIFVRKTADAKALVIEAKLLSGLNGFEKNNPPRQELLKIGAQIAGAIRVDVVCRLDEEHDNIIASLTVLLADGMPDLITLAQCIGDLSQTQKKFDDFLSGKITDEEADRIVQKNWLNQQIKDRTPQQIAAELIKGADEIEKLFNNLK